MILNFKFVTCQLLNHSPVKRLTGMMCLHFTSLSGVYLFFFLNVLVNAVILYVEKINMSFENVKVIEF